MSTDIFEYGIIAKLDQRIDESSNYTLPNNFKINYQGTLIRYIIQTYRQEYPYCNEIFTSIPNIEWPYRISGVPKWYINGYNDCTDNPADEISLIDFENL